LQDFAETIRVRFDPEVLSYDDVLKLFLDFHRPAERAYTGTQYRSAIFWHTDAQREAALAWRRQQATLTGGMIDACVSVEAARDFYRAEEYHQKYKAKALADR
jgi:peptide-methionine (S)-S-oxide reductase